MIALRLTVPMACWRKGHARELLETEALPPPATCYGALLSLVGETERLRHRGARVTAGLIGTGGRSPAAAADGASGTRRSTRSTILRTLWRIKSSHEPQGNGDNARPDFQQLVMGADLLIFCDSAEEGEPDRGLEVRVREAMRSPGSVSRFGGWCLGESTHLINDAWLLDGSTLPSVCDAFLLAESGRMTLPVWVDHVATRGTRYATGRVEAIEESPPVKRVPRIEPPA